MPVPHDYDAEIKKLQEEVAELQKQLEEQKQNAPYIGDNGNWFVNGQDTGVPAQGPKGEGETGKNLWWKSNDYASGKWFNASLTLANVSVNVFSLSVTGASLSVSAATASFAGASTSAAGTDNKLKAALTDLKAMKTKCEAIQTDLVGKKQDTTAISNDIRVLGNWITTLETKC